LFLFLNLLCKALFVSRAIKNTQVQLTIIDYSLSQKSSQLSFADWALFWFYSLSWNKKDSIWDWWFYVWQSQLKDTQIKAIQFSILILSCLMFVASNANENVAIW